MCGRNEQGELGLNDESIKKITTPIINPFLENIKQISCGFKHSMALSNEGELFVFGSNGRGQIGMKEIAKIEKPTGVPSLPEIVSISCRYAYSAIIDCEGCVWTCGSNGYGQLGVADITERKIFTKLT